MRRMAFVIGSAVAILVSSVVPASALSPVLEPGQESQDAAAAQDWFTGQRMAPNDAVDPNAFDAVADQASQLGTVGGQWTERTNLPGADGNDFSDSPLYIDPTSSFSNSGAGDRWVTGRMTSLAEAPDGTIFAGAADGGVWKTTDRGQTWTPLTDTQRTLSIGALLVVPNDGGYTLYVGTGEANTSSDSYAGVGVLATSDGGSSWRRVGGTDLNGALIFRIAQGGGTIIAATSHGLYRYDPAADRWNATLQPGGGPTGGNFNLKFRNMITDVAVRPGTGGQEVLAVAGWRAGAPTNGLYLSQDGGTTFTYLSSPQGWPLIQDEGRTTLAYSAGGDRLYAVVQSPYLLTVGTNGKTLLTGAFSSDNGDPNGPWTQIAQSEQLANSGSAQDFRRIGTKHYGPGIQAWYNQFLAVDPANKDHVYLGLEEVYESQDGGGKWNTIAPYWNFGFSCFSYSPFEGTCDHNQAHSDQHAAMITHDGNLYIGNDGGVYSRSLSNHLTGHWTNRNQQIDSLQYYSAAGSKDSIIYGGLQDNGSNKVFTIPTQVLDDRRNPINVSSVQVFGGDGGYTLVDPTNSNNVITEYVGLTVLKSTDGGANWHFIVPADPHPRFIAPIAMDRTNASHLVAGGAIVWNSDVGIADITGWTNILDLRTATGNPAAQVSVLDAVTIGGVEYVAAAWCGFCNPGFHSGIVMLNNDGGWHVTSSVTTEATSGSGLPKRYITGVRIDTADPNHAYLTLSGYSRHWLIGPTDPGADGHIFETKDGGNTWSNRSGNLMDVPTNDIVLLASGTLVVGTDFGVYTSADNGATWNRLGTNFPNVVVTQLVLDPNGNLIAATHGRGVWTIAAP